MVRPRIIIPVFPGTNCEYDSMRAFESVGGTAKTLVVRNLSAQDIEESVAALAKAIENSQILMLPGGFSAGDEPDGSGKFIAALFHSPRLTEAVMKFLQERLILKKQWQDADTSGSADQKSRQIICRLFYICVQSFFSSFTNAL